MKHIKSLCILTLLMLTLNICGQTTNDKFASKKTDAENQLKLALKDTVQHNVIDNKNIIIKDSLTAISISELILFNIYGKKNITNQKPYEIDLIDNYWIIRGTLPKGYKGGNFLIILDSRNSKIIKITHGK